MKKRKKLVMSWIAACAVAIAPSALAAVVVPGADGTDGIFNPNASVTINLAEAATGAWDSASPAAGKGVYDPEKWAVVFKYQRVVVREGVTIDFAPHPSGAPVVWLVSEDVTITGSVNLNGKTGHSAGDRRLIPAPPGGFMGGMAGEFFAPGGGFGFGGGFWSDSFYNGGGRRGERGSFASNSIARNSNTQVPIRTYGNARLIPLIGGSGGSGGQVGNPGDIGSGGGSAGGGAFLIATQGKVILSGSIEANSTELNTGSVWDGGAGSGGAIRIVAERLEGAGHLRATSLNGGNGRIRVETNSIGFGHAGEPHYTAGFPGETAELWPDASAPIVRLVSLAGAPVPVDPKGNVIDFTQADVPLATEDLAQLVIETENIDPQADVQVRVTPLSGQNDDYPAFFISTTDGVSTWHADLPLGQGFSAIQVRVVTQ